MPVLLSQSQKDVMWQVQILQILSLSTTQDKFALKHFTRSLRSLLQQYIFIVVYV